MFHDRLFHLLIRLAVIVAWYGARFFGTDFLLGIHYWLCLAEVHVYSKRLKTQDELYVALGW